MILQYKNVQLKTGSKHLKEEVRVSQDWFIQYYIEEAGEWKRYKYRKDLNSNPDYKTFNKKLFYGEALLQVVKDLLANGTPPHSLALHKLSLGNLVKFAIEEKIPAYLAHKSSNGNRSKTISSYKSKLKYFEETFGKFKLAEIQTEAVQKWLYEIAEKKSWSNTTYNQARIILYNFFEYLRSFGNVEVNPISKVKTRKKVVNSDTHKPFSQDTLKKILDHLDLYDKTTALFVRMIYHTCARPIEIRQLTVGHFDLNKKTLFIPETISKNKRADYLPVNEDLLNHLLKHGIENQHKTKLLFGEKGRLFSDTKIGENTIYDRFMKVLKKLEITEHGYTLYSVKHTSNIIRYQNNWTIAEIMKANRHANITETENYLRKMGEFIEPNKNIPNL